MVRWPGTFSEPSLAPDSPSLVVTKFVGGRRKARTAYVVPKAAPVNDRCVYNSDIVTLERAIKERVLNVKTPHGWAPPPRPSVNFGRRLALFARMLGKHLPSTTPVSRQNFVDMYKGRKQVIYQQAADSLMITGISASDFKIKAFVKAEKGKPGSAPRVIQPRHPRCNVEIGKFLKPIEERVYDAIAEVFGEETVMKGYNARGVARVLRQKWNRFTNPVALGLDASRFDQHVSRDALAWEHSVYVRCFKKHYRSELRWLLSQQLRNRGVGYCSDGKLRYSTVGVRASGDMNTALGNCVLMCAMVWAYANHMDMVKDISLVNNGDDCVVIMERGDLAKFQGSLNHWFLQMGFTMVAEPPVYDFERIEFCQAHPLFDGDSYIMVRNILAFTKDSVALIPVDKEHPLKCWLGAVGDGGMTLTGGIPIWQEYYAWYQRSAGALSSKRRRRGAVRIFDQSAFETGMAQMAKGMDRKYGEVSDAARYSFWLAFGITPDHQVALEKQYASLPNITPPSARDFGQYHPLPHQGFSVAY